MVRDSGPAVPAVAPGVGAVFGGGGDLLRIERAFARRRAPIEFGLDEAIQLTELIWMDLTPWPRDRRLIRLRIHLI